MAMDAGTRARAEFDGLLSKWREAVGALVDHHAKADNAGFDPQVHDQAWFDRLRELETEHRNAYEGLLSRWPQLMPELARFKMW